MTPGRLGYLLHVTEADAPPIIQLRHKRMQLQVRPGTSRVKCQALLEEWYRHQIREAVSPLTERWEKRLAVKVEKIFVQRMKTKWGSCNPSTHSIRLNTDLAKKPLERLEYIVVHELMHLLEPTHSARFQSLMDQHHLKWRSHQQILNRLPVRHESWGY